MMESHAPDWPQKLRQVLDPNQNPISDRAGPGWGSLFFVVSLSNSFPRGVAVAMRASARDLLGAGVGLLATVVTLF